VAKIMNNDCKWSKEDEEAFNELKKRRQMYTDLENIFDNILKDYKNNKISGMEVSYTQSDSIPTMFREYSIPRTLQITIEYKEDA
jgi:hypothetical protein